MVGLGIFCNREDIIDEYIDMLHTDPEAASINIAYNLAYCGDQSLEKTLEEGYCNKGKIKCNRLIWEIFYHLKSEKYKNGWALDILILRTLFPIQYQSVVSRQRQLVVPYIPSPKFFSSSCREYLPYSTKNSTLFCLIFSFPQLTPVVFGSKF